jgi:hypothetical protein
VVFSIILISGLGMYESSLSRANLYSQADFESYLEDNRIALVSTSATNILLWLQSFLEGSVLECASASSSVGAAVGGLSDSQTVMYLSESSQAQVAVESSRPDNLSALFPFNGSVPASLDLSVRSAAMGGGPSAGVWLAKTEVHLLHLSFRLEAAVADCLEAVRAIEGAASGFAMENCTATNVASFMDAASAKPALVSAADGFKFGLAYAIAGTTPCSVRFQVSIEQVDISGPGGPFNVRMQENGTAEFA